MISKPLFSRHGNHWYVTLSFLLSGFLFVKITEALIGAMTPPQGVIFDRLHEWTSPLNYFFHQHPLAANFVLITTSFWIDAGILFLSLRALFGPTIRPFLELFLFGLLRQSLQFLVTLPIPQGIIWANPGFPSFMVNYSIQHDLYFSAHTGISLLVVLELLRTEKKWLYRTGIFFFAYVMITLITFRIHYTMDVFTGLFVALTIHLISKEMALSFDQWMQRIHKYFLALFAEISRQNLLRIIGRTEK